MPWKMTLRNSTGSVSWIRLIPTMGMAILTVVLLNAVVDAWHAPVGRASLPPRNTSPLHLRARMGAEQMEVSWDHDSAAIHEAERGNLEILDGGVTESVPFEPPQLQDGVLVYRPRSNDVSVRLEVSERSGEKISESVRAVRTP